MTTGPAIPARLGAREVMTADRLEASLKDINLEEMMKALSGRLDGHGQAAFVQDQAAAREQVAALAAAFADDPYYRPLLEWLLDITLRRPVSIWGLGQDAQEYVDRREGGNAIAWQLLQAIAEGRGEQPPPREGT